MRKTKFKISILFFLGGLLMTPVHAEKLKIVTTYPYISSITQQITGDLAHVETLAKGNWNPHYVVPKPSLIVKLRDANLLITNGGELEVGWLPPLISQASNARLSGHGTLSLAHYAKLIEIPSELNRKFGDVHPEGNPHFILDPDNVIPAAKAIEERLEELDPAHSEDFKKNMAAFLQKWKEQIIRWNSAMSSLKGAPIVQYHKLFNYLLLHFGLVEAGNVERLPGIPPTAQHLAELEKIIKAKNVKILIQDVYNPDDAAKLLAKKMNLRLIYLPHDVGAVPDAKDIFLLFDEIVQRIIHE